MINLNETYNTLEDLVTTQAGPFDCLKELSDVIVDAINEGYTDSVASFVITWRGVDLCISVAMEKENA